MPRPPRRPLVAANWKMHKTVAESEAFLGRLLGALERLEGIEIVVCPPYTALAAAVERTSGSPVRIAAQNVHFEPSGAFTGEISTPMLIELGVGAAIVGHSERRELFCESDEALARKGWAHAWQVNPGGHNPAYWRGHLRDYLRFYGRAFVAGGAAAGGGPPGGSVCSAT